MANSVNVRLRASSSRESVKGHKRRLYTNEELKAFVDQERPLWAWTRSQNVATAFLTRRRVVRASHLGRRFGCILTRN